MIRHSACVAVILYVAGSYQVSDVADAVRRAEEARIAAVVNGDPAAAEPFIASDALQVDRAGALVFRADILKNYAHANAFTVESTALEPFGQGAIITGVAQEPSGDRFRVARVWHQSAGRWMMVFNQVTPIKETPITAGFERVAAVPTAAADTDVARDIVRVQNALQQALLTKDAVQYGALTVEQFAAVGPDGQVTSRAEFLKDVVPDSRADRRGTAADDARVRVYDPIAIVTYSDDSPARTTQMFIRVDDAWKQLMVQVTPVREPRH